MPYDFFSHKNDYYYYLLYVEICFTLIICVKLLNIVIWPCIAIERKKWLGWPYHSQFLNQNTRIFFHFWLVSYFSYYIIHNYTVPKPFFKWLLNEEEAYRETKLLILKFMFVTRYNITSSQFFHWNFTLNDTNHIIIHFVFLYLRHAYWISLAPNTHFIFTLHVVIRTWKESISIKKKVYKSTSSISGNQHEESAKS